MEGDPAIVEVVIVVYILENNYIMNHLFRYSLRENVA